MEWILILVKNYYRQDLQDYQDILDFRFPDETGNIQSAPRNTYYHCHDLCLSTFSR